MAEIENAVTVALAMIQAGERGTNHDAFVNEVLHRVSERIGKADLDGAATLLDDQLDRLKRDESTLLESAIQVEILRRDPEAAARRIDRLVTTQHPSDEAARLDALVGHWNRYRDEGRDKGINLSLEVAIAIASLGRSHCRMPYDAGKWYN